LVQIKQHGLQKVADIWKKNNSNRRQNHLSDRSPSHLSLKHAKAARSMEREWFNSWFHPGKQKFAHPEQF
jgi:hypothetical protein